MMLDKIAWCGKLSNNNIQHDALFASFTKNFVYINSWFYLSVSVNMKISHFFNWFEIIVKISNVAYYVSVPIMIKPERNDIFYLFVTFHDKEH